MTKPFTLERVRFPYTIRDPDTKKPIVNIFDLTWLPAILHLPEILEELNEYRQKEGLPVESYRDLKSSIVRSPVGMTISLPVSEGDIFITKKGDRYKVISIGQQITLDWLDGKYRRDVTRETLAKHYTREKKPDEEEVVNEGILEIEGDEEEEEDDGVPSDL
ncbi:MAG: hypothetical protein QUS07_07230 [Methanothrix sp.]|nr:hypothetical protein [Methanothrix sp.]